MDRRTGTYLAALDARFYAEHAASFADTRQAPWPGWERLLETLPDDDVRAPLEVLDVACGNMRLAEYLEGALPGREISYRGIDSCDALVPGARAGAFRHADLVSALLDAGTPFPEGDAAPANRFDLVCCFGFMHHVPGSGARKALLRWLVERARPGGTVAVSFWRFLSEPRLAAKARAATGRALARDPWLDLDENDRLLGWQGDAGALRYCHHFDEREVYALAASVADVAAPIARYRADGRTGALNGYLVLRRTRPGNL